MATTLQANLRTDLTGSSTRQIRKDGHVPAILYGNKIDSQPVYVESVEFLKTVREVGKNGLFSLNVDGSKHQVMIHDMQIDPLKNEYLHVDFFEVDMKSEIDADVPVRLTGESPGSTEGGVVTHLLYDISVKCLPNDIPEEIELDISELNIGDSIQITDLRDKVSVEITNEDEETVVTVQPPTVIEESEDADESGDAEPEVIGEDDSNKEE
ncbi:50S ribosomal protein L25/general stress protein Ctc [Alkalihalophilus lindianensis]|uniref:Large ribosomal subunit protein bL25 n=1 Tax=Alkalihalophilus lindianensis TaxID=1630542 RepID=A0ABU3XFS9_9BACI|nr:50S ribosomal protein L25/general stress protein Ctc [Alkalihalophilus lindianensis]MDV2686755.1 50S ribosomal protein L25/general stress protein Ctc [Alkalihalophilus lindianensis]